MLILIREDGTDRLAARAHGSVRDAFRQIWRDRDLRWLYLTSILGGGGRGLGVVEPLRPALPDQGDRPRRRPVGRDVRRAHRVLGADAAHRRLAVGPDRPEAAHRRASTSAGRSGFIAFLVAGSSLVGLWVGIVIMGLFSFAESPQLQALLADIAPPGIRDAAFAAYFTLAFGVGSLWVAGYGVIIDGLATRPASRSCSRLMAVTFLLAAVATLPIRTERRD